MSITNNQLTILNKRIGIAGCGEMGYPMLKVLLQNNINATGHDIKASKIFANIIIIINYVYNKQPIKYS